jgi:hypothetical protein
LSDPDGVVGMLLSRFIESFEADGDVYSLRLRDGLVRRLTPFRL